MSRGIWSEQDFAGLPSLSVAAHELKSPITLMRQLALAIQSGDLTIEEERAYTQRLVLMADRSLQLTHDLAQVANLQSSFLPLEPVNPLAVCQSLYLSASPMAKAYGRDIIWPKNRNTVLVSANRQLLRSIIANFVDNALKYSQDDAPISVKVVRQKDQKLRIAVRDFGPRITMSEYRRIVSEMDRLKTLKTRPDSSGLGIFIASQFAKAMGGQIGLVRHRDGVTFYVDLAVSEQLKLI